MTLNGKTRLLGLFGNPVKHTASPAMHNAAFAALKLNNVYLPFEITPENLESAVSGLRALNFVGVNVTIPYKQDVMPFLDGVSNDARLIGAVNTIRLEGKRLIGYNTDGRGFLRFLQDDAGISIKGKKITLVGAGGAGRAVSVQSALEGAKQITIADSDAGRAKVLADHISSKLPKCPAQSVAMETKEFAEAIGGADIVVDATPLGMHVSDPTAFDPALLSKKTVVVDLVYNPAITKLVRGAKKKGCKAYNGLGMLFYQGAIAFELWTGRPAPTEVMRKALKKAIS
jgi:shikimate dehydrogenase